MAPGMNIEIDCIAWKEERPKRIVPRPGRAHVRAVQWFVTITSCARSTVLAEPVVRFGSADAFASSWTTPVAPTATEEPAGDASPW